MPRLFAIFFGKAYFWGSLLLCAFCYALTAQTTKRGTPLIKNFTPDLYKSAAQNWAIVQDTNGILYFGNNYGVMEYTGSVWRLILQPTNRTIVRSLALNRQHTIFVGAQNELGYISKDAFGQMSYVSLKSKIPSAYLNFTDVWNIFIEADKVVFQTSEALYIYQNNNFTVVSPPSRIITAAQINGQIVLLDAEKGIGYLNKSHLEWSAKAIPAALKNVNSLLPFSNNSILIVSDEGLWRCDEKGINPLQTESSEWLRQYHPQCSKILRDGVYAVGTINNGVIFFNSAGEIIQHFNSTKGLLNNTVLALYEDETGNLWTAVDAGISYLQTASPFYFIGTEYGLQGAVYSTAIYQKKLYVATNQGVYYATWPLPRMVANSGTIFKSVDGLQGQAWKLTVINNALFVAHNRGTFVVEGSSLYSVQTKTGGWNFAQALANDSNNILHGTYQGLQWLSKQSGRWLVKSNIKGFNETCREVYTNEQGVIWVVHGYKGVFRVELNDGKDSVIHQTLYNTQKGLPSDLFTNLIVLNGKLLLGTQKGVYEYDAATDKMVVNKEYAGLLGLGVVRKMQTAGDNRIFFIKNYDMVDECGFLIKNTNGNAVVLKTPFQPLKGRFLPAFEDINCVNENDMLLGSKSGLIIYSSNSTRHFETAFHTLINNVFITRFKDSVLFGNTFDAERVFRKDTSIIPIPFNYNAVTFNFSSTFYENNEATLFQTYLEGFDDDWSLWNNKLSKEYTNIPEGKYTFRVRSKNCYEVIGTEAVFRFVIKTPWYRTFCVYALFNLAIIGVIAAILKIKNKQLIREKKLLEFKQQQALNEKQAAFLNSKIENDRKLAELSKQKMETDLESKIRELASSAMHLIQSGKTLSEIKEKVEEAYSTPPEEVKNKLKRILSLIEFSMDDNDNWKNFEIHFDHINQNFLQRLKKQFPQLNHKDIRLCAYLRMNLDTKEIAQSMGISLRGVESMRYRVRKKMQLETDTNLTDFIINF